MKNRVFLELIPSFIIILSFFTAWALFHIWTRHMATELGYTISAEQTLKEELLGDNKSLKLEISTLKSSRRLESIAKNKLGMSTPRPEQVVYVWLDE
ncbi:MAG: Cell division protein FtsL [Deltaproteobacteria bacterium ADurb.BinA179]|jgi:cell division protein FtsL|nr:MAG: Cell division protein FtsL [Deltaproteobacteria bacterium ADurb.BinA179]HNU73819.1 cell division protein FtsL [Deltaproteobacteria bacterium]HOD70772.1 cell division protein FtsL [Deltaproteobacteria bacterium]HOS26803.1 cell division protein FtsL [Deltaproteobacteria bacterium]HPA83341.1 cell division protein FtsL [Deltaproteobacteria bacterium]